MNNNLEDHLQILGHEVKDVVTGFVGIVTTISFDLYGCVQAVVTPLGVDKDGKLFSGHYFDTTRLEIAGKRVMEIPDFTPRLRSTPNTAAGTHETTRNHDGI